MAWFDYKMQFSPYASALYARNYKEAWKALQETFPKYDVTKCCSYLQRRY